MDKIKSLFSGGSSAGAQIDDHAGHDHAHEAAPPADPSLPEVSPTPEWAEPTKAEDSEQ